MMASPTFAASTTLRIHENLQWHRAVSLQQHGFLVLFIIVSSFVEVCKLFSLHSCSTKHSTGDEN